MPAARAVTPASDAPGQDLGLELTKTHHVICWWEGVEKQALAIPETRGEERAMIFIPLSSKGKKGWKTAELSKEPQEKF